MIHALCTVWLLTASCSDDALAWAPSSYCTRVIWNQTVDLPPMAGRQLIGCWEGTVRVAHFDCSSGLEGDPSFIPWEADPGRLLAWDNPCSIDRYTGQTCGLPACGEN